MYLLYNKHTIGYITYDRTILVRERLVSPSVFNFLCIFLLRFCLVLVIMAETGCFTVNVLLCLYFSVKCIENS